MAIKKRHKARQSHSGDKAGQRGEARDSREEEEEDELLGSQILGLKRPDSSLLLSREDSGCFQGPNATWPPMRSSHMYQSCPTRRIQHCQNEVLAPCSSEDGLGHVHVDLNVGPFHRLAHDAYRIIGEYMPSVAAR